MLSTRSLLEGVAAAWWPQTFPTAPTTACCWSGAASHARLPEDRPLSTDEIILYLAHSRVTEQRAAEQVAQMLDCFRNDPELERGLAMVADDEVNHLSYCHEEFALSRAGTR